MSRDSAAVWPVDLGGLAPLGPSEPRPRWIARRATLDGFAAAVAEADGLDLRALAPITSLTVDTRNTRYRVTVTRPRLCEVVLHGGQFFPDPTEGRVWGSSFGGSLLKLGWIGVGLRMELWASAQLIVTSPVRRIAIAADGALPGPF